MKFHHCLMDGTSGAGLAEVLADLKPDADGPAFVPDAYTEATPREPSRGKYSRSWGLRRGFQRTHWGWRIRLAYIQHMDFRL